MNYPFINFNGASNFIPQFTGTCDDLSMLGLKLTHVSKRDPSYMQYLMKRFVRLFTYLIGEGNFSFILHVTFENGD